MVVPIDGGIEKKLDALLALESQMIEGCVSGHEGLVPKNGQERVVRVAAVREGLQKRFASTADRYRNVMIECCGEEVGKKAQYAEAFELWLVTRLRRFPQTPIHSAFICEICGQSNLSVCSRFAGFGRFL